MYSSSIRNLIDKLSKLPTIGPRTAARLVFFLMAQDNKQVKELIQALADLKNRVKVCRLCFNAFESEKELCSVCSDSKREKSQLCVVANEIDLETLEKTKKYKGLYFVLGGTVSILKKENLAGLRIEQLEDRVKKGNYINEIILAINPTSEGQTTILYLEKILKPYGKKITKLGVGLPMGGELEYADEETLTSALEGRK
ncbi:MAG: recombination mediator RecR [Candidatus Pacebacteria bacterium]|nr:recombination mediator RecR [Candidatus Paceibacterota bacterium]